VSRVAKKGTEESEEEKKERSRKISAAIRVG
jgi:hypothetical protein